MSAARRFVATLILVVAVVLLVRHGAAALRPSRPKDMPATAQFIVSGYDLPHNEPKGDCIACRPDLAENANFCRVTDSHGVVIYQGEFLPVSGHRPVSQANLRVASADLDLDHIFVRGPAEGGLVPVIPLVGGELLVPAADSIALADRCNKNPDELQRIQAQ